jgi:hypothetical protein
MQLSKEDLRVQPRHPQEHGGRLGQAPGALRNHSKLPHRSYRNSRPRAATHGTPGASNRVDVRYDARWETAVRIPRRPQGAEQVSDRAK